MDESDRCQPWQGRRPEKTLQEKTGQQPVRPMVVQPAESQTHDSQPQALPT